MKSKEIHFSKGVVKIVFAICIILSFSPSEAVSQKQNSVWVFGEGLGINFNATPPILSHGYQPCLDAGSSICDKSGNLLFYTNGKSAINLNHEKMPWGHPDVHLLGAGNTQSTVIVPFPENSKKFYLVCANANRQSFRFTYSLVDLALNAGKGAIVEKMQSMPITSDTDDVVLAVWHANRTDFWLIIRNEDGTKLFTYLLTREGISEKQTECNIPNGKSDKASPGQLKASKNAKYLVSKSNLTTLQVYSFDNETGVIQPNKHYTFTGANMYGLGSGVEFSADGTKLYALAYTSNAGGSYNTNMYQFDLTEPALTPIEIGRHNASDENYYWRQMQLAINGKIYISAVGGLEQKGYRHLASIEEPNKLGQACSFLKKSIEFNSGYTTHCLPNFPVYPPEEISFETKSTCVSNNFTLTPYLPFAYKSIVWHFGDGHTSTSTNPTHAYEAAGDYTVKLTVTYADTTTETIEKQITIHAKPKTPAIQFQP